MATQLFHESELYRYQNIDFFLISNCSYGNIYMIKYWPLVIEYFELTIKFFSLLLNTKIFWYKNVTTLSIYVPFKRTDHNLIPISKHVRSKIQCYSYRWMLYSTCRKRNNFIKEDYSELCDFGYRKFCSVVKFWSTNKNMS